MKIIKNIPTMNDYIKCKFGGYFYGRRFTNREKKDMTEAYWRHLAVLCLSSMCEIFYGDIEIYKLNEYHYLSMLALD